MQDTQATSSANVSRAPRAVTGWVLPHLTRLDEAAPGSLRRVMCGSNLRRQTTFFTLARILRDGAPNVACALPQNFLDRDAEQVIAGALAALPAQIS